MSNPFVNITDSAYNQFDRTYPDMEKLRMYAEMRARLLEQSLVNPGTSYRLGTSIYAANNTGSSLFLSRNSRVSLGLLTQLMLLHDYADVRTDMGSGSGFVLADLSKLEANPDICNFVRAELFSGDDTEDPDTEEKEELYALLIEWACQTDYIPIKRSSKRLLEIMKVKYRELNEI